MDDEKRRVLLDELIRYTAPEKPPPDTFSTNEYVDRCAELGDMITARAAQERLKNAMRRGKIEGKKVSGAWRWKVAAIEEGA